MNRQDSANIQNKTDPAIVSQGEVYLNGPGIVEEKLAKY